MFAILQLLSWFVLFNGHAAAFSPEISDYDAYGLKVAANNLMIVQADNQYSTFYIQFADYNDSITGADDRFCNCDYPDPSEYDFPDSEFYIYTVTLGKSPSAAYNIYFAGEMTDLDEDDAVVNRTFVGTITYTGFLTTIDCEDGFTPTIIQFVPNAVAHQVHLVLVANPLGTAAYGFSDYLTFSFTVSPNSLVVRPNNSLSRSAAFLPFAVDYDDNHGIVAGLLCNSQTTRVTCNATVILFTINASTAVATPLATWTYPSNSSTWQSGLTFRGAEKYDPEYDMSVSINPAATQALVGIQAMNSVFLFNYTTNALTPITSIDRGQGIGFGKGVAWLRDTPHSVAILANVYTASYVWSSSTIYIYDSPLTNVSTPVSVFPNIQQLLYGYMSSVFIDILTTPDHLIFLDDQGNFFIILSAPAGYFASTTGPDVQSFIATSSQTPCPAGTYKNVDGIRPCAACRAGTKNNGTSPTTCLNCSASTFCPLGSATDSISDDQLGDVLQALPYPESPDIAGLDDILFFTLFSIGSTGRCVALSPIFWTLLVGAIVILITGVMLIIKYCVKDRKASNTYKVFRNVFKQADLIREGNMWAGGLATFCVIVLCIACCVFSAKYYASYPIEEVGDSTYTCDTSIRNAQFSTSLRPLSLPVSDSMKEMIDLLNKQAVNINVAFLNTISSCISADVATLKYLLGSTWRPVSPTPTCTASNYVVAYSAVLPFRLITIQYTLPNTNIVGGLRIGLNAPGQSKSSTATIQELNFSQVLKQSEHMLGQNARVFLQLTKVINKTSPLVAGNDDVLSGIWIGTFTVNYYESFLTDSEYLVAPPQTSTNLTIAITETPYFILNEQDPIARLPEIIYHDFLFITMIIGMFVLIFVIIEVMIIPSTKFLIGKCRSKNGDKQEKEDSRKLSAADSPPPLEQPFTSIQFVNRSENDNHRASSAWKREAYL